LTNRLSFLNRYAKENLHKAKESSKQYYDKRIKHLILDMRNFIYVLHGTIRKGSKKLIDQYNSPFKIIRRIGEVNYEIKRGRRNQIQNTLIN